MTENTEYTVNTTCPGNYGCTNDSAATDIDPATGVACFSNTTAKSSDTTVKSGAPKKASQMQALHTAIATEIIRHRVSPKHVSIDAAVGGQISFEKTMKRIKENLTRLTGYELPVDVGSLMKASDIQTAYQKLNTAQEECICVNRCTCNARANCPARTAEDGTVEKACACNTVADCKARCSCNCDAVDSSCKCNVTSCRCASRRTWAVTGWCHCDTDCDCNGRCNCNTDCKSRCNCNCNAKESSCLNNTVTCASRCGCVTRTTVECTCNIRTACASFVAN
jgi:hypothetical protein